MLAQQQIEALKLGVGDIIDFDRGTLNSPNPQLGVRVDVALSDWLTTPAKTCTLDTQTMMGARGSLIVEAREQPSIYRVHWAGRATSASASNCGEDAELLISADPLARLANVVDGFGLRDAKQPMPAFPESAAIFWQ